MSYYLIYPIFYLVSLLPRKAQRGVSHLIYWALYKAAHYRLTVVRENLARSFPEKSEQERMEIEQKFYKHLGDIFLETILMATISAKEIDQRIEFINKEQIERYTRDTSWIAAMAHYGSWEYTIAWGLHSRHDKVLAVYRPLTDKGFDRYYRRTRGRFGVDPVAMESVGREIIKANADGRKITLALIADQNPSTGSQNWVEFLGQKTLFFNGMEKLAQKFRMPVAFMHIDKFGDDHYKAWFEVIYDGKEELPVGEITRRYAAHLEAMIRSKPELWMWSHRRWKHTPPDSTELK